MSKKAKNSQIVIRITEQLDKKIQKLADKRGLTKASWGRELFIESVARDENEKS